MEGGGGGSAVPEGDAFWRRAAWTAALAAVYFVAGRLSLRLSFLPSLATPVWLPSGIAVAALLLGGGWLWAGVFLGSLFVSAASGQSVWIACPIAAGNVLEAWLGAWAARRLAGGKEALSHPRGVAVFTLLSGFGAALASAAIGAASLCVGRLRPWERCGSIGLSWWLADAAGIVVVAPLLILAATEKFGRWSKEKSAEAGLLFAAVILTGWAVLGGAPAARNYPLDFLCLPVVLWPAFRFGRRETAFTALLLSGAAVGGALRGHGPFFRSDVFETVLLLQIFCAITAAAALAVSSVVDERRRDQEILQGSRRTLEEAVRSRTESLTRTLNELQDEIARRGLVETALERRTRELASSNQELQQFASVVSHELQEPLRKILTFGDLLKTMAADPRREEWEYAERMEDSARRMQRLVEGILELSRTTGETPPLAPVDLGEVAREVASDFEPLVAEMGGNISIGRLPILNADRLQMRRLFSNLISNAYKFRNKAGAPSIRISAEDARDGFVRILVEDNGIGFEEEFAETIFKPFGRLHRRTDYEGSGLGLAICRRIAMRHGGDIAAKGRPGQGAVFVVTLPV